MSAQMNARRARAKAARKASKEGKKHKLSDTAAEFKIPAATATSSSSGSGSSGGSSGGDSSPDGETVAKKTKKSAKPPPATAFGHQKEAKAAKVAKTIQDDPTKSEVYKRLFSTHETALNQPKGNWVTFDPRYN